MPKTFHVICCNDSIEYVVEEDRHCAEEKMKELKENLNQAHPENSKYLYWHIHKVEGE